MADLITITNVLSSFGTNCYTIADSSTREAIIIDPAARGDFLINMYKSQNLKPVAILLTHGHVDHIGAIPELRKEYPDIKVYAGKDEEALLGNAHANLSAQFGEPITLSADEYVSDGQEISLLGRTIKCISVPGHTIGGTCYYFADDKLLYSGDTLFAGSVGRSDFPTGDAEALLENIESKLFVLPDDVSVFSGHGGKTTIKREKAGNPFF